MRIDEVSLLTVRLPLRHSFQTSSHRKSFLRHVLVRAVASDGSIGWGEVASPSDPYYSAETVETALLVLERYLAPRVMGVEWSHPDEVAGLMSKVRGHEFAKAGLDIAAWDLSSAAQGVPLSRALGGTRESVEAGVSLGIEPSIDDLLTEVSRHVGDGYGRVKLKIMPGWDVEAVAAVRRAFPDVVVHVDANGAYPDSADARDVMRALDGQGLAMIEQPFAPRDFLASARLQAEIDTPVCLDESIVAVHDIETMLALDAGRVVNIKVSRMGGLSAAREAHDRAVAAGIPVWCGGMHEFGIGRAANVAISSLPGFTYPSDVSGSDKYYARDVIVPPVVAHSGVVAVPTASGLGVVVDEAFVRENLEAETVVTA